VDRVQVPWSKLQEQNQLFPVQMLKTNIECKMAEIISSEELPQKLNYTEWSHVIRKSDFLGHLRLHLETSAKRALREARRNNKKPEGRPTETWLKNVQRQLDMDFGLTLEAAETTAHNRTTEGSGAWGLSLSVQAI